MDLDTTFIGLVFVVVSNDARGASGVKNVAYLWADNWNDWYKYKTLYNLTIYDNNGDEYNIGGVKVGQFDWKESQSRPELPNRFEKLDTRFFSLGQDADYYEKLFAINRNTANNVLRSLRDIAADANLFLEAKNENITGESLMRSVNEMTIYSQFRRIINGGARLTKFSFEYQGPCQINKELRPVAMDFSVEPSSKPPTNIQVVIGRNGVGKSYYLNAMSRALVTPDEDIEINGQFLDKCDSDHGLDSPFANVVSVTFSAFDDFPVIRENRNALKGVRYTNVGLRKIEKIKDKDSNVKTRIVTQDPNDLATVFISSAKLCISGERADRWIAALKTLESDPIFEESEISGLINYEDEKFSREAGRIFRRLSSGHKIVLLTITKLVEKVEERTLVLMDEPEAHLHPPLLSALVRAVSGVAPAKPDTPQLLTSG